MKAFSKPFVAFDAWRHITSHVFGNGIDGDVTISSPVTLTRHWFYRNLTVNSTLTPAGYGIFCQDTLLIGSSGRISLDGSAGTGGGNPGEPPVQNSWGGGLGFGGAGGNNSDGDAGETVPDAFGGSGGGGGNSPSFSGGAGGVASATNQNYTRLRSMPFSQNPGLVSAAILQTINMGGGGGGGAGDSVPGNLGGGGGGSGGCIFLGARRIFNKGIITCTGGGGGTPIGEEEGDMGSGGGGGGGVVILVVHSYHGTVPSVNGGAGGGLPPGLGNPGVAGLAGTVFTLVL